MKNKDKSLAQNYERKKKTFYINRYTKIFNVTLAKQFTTNDDKAGSTTSISCEDDFSNVS